MKIIKDEIKKARGQFFTTKDRVLNALTSLVQNRGDILEPSAGQGHIIKKLESLGFEDINALELDKSQADKKLCESQIIVGNFFNFEWYENYDTVIGNPPFVKLKNVEKPTMDILPEKINQNGNLYYYFIKYSVALLRENGELIFIVPKEWLYNVSSQFVRDYLSEYGTFTHFIDCGEEKLFDDADVPALCIFRYQKDYTGQTKYYKSLDDYYNDTYELKIASYGKTISFVNEIVSGSTLSDFFDLKVGLVTGAEPVYKITNPSFLIDGYYKEIITTDRQITNYLYLEDFDNLEDVPQPIKDYFEALKPQLKARKIKKYTDKNYWKYGAIRNLDLMSSNRPRILCLMKTREENFFWVGPQNVCYSGGILGLFPKPGVNFDLEQVVTYLNSDEFKEILKENNMYSNTKVSITPSVLGSVKFNFVSSE